MHGRAPSPVSYLPVVAPGGSGNSTGALIRAPRLPRFDEHGNLPPTSSEGAIRHGHAGFGPSGIAASLTDIHQRFVVEPEGSVRRPRIWDGWMGHRRAMAACGVPFVTLVGGSFLTERFEPSDVDLCYLVDGRAIEGADDGTIECLNSVLSDPEGKDTYLCDINYTTTYPMDHPNFLSMVQMLTYWSSVFGISKEGKMRSFLIVAEQGTL